MKMFHNLLPQTKRQTTIINNKYVTYVQFF